MSAELASEDEVICYVCLNSIRWNSLEPQRYDPATGTFAPIKVSRERSPVVWQRAVSNAYVRCPFLNDDRSWHYLSFAYGQHGQPIVVGFVGESSSGKTHLLSAMVQAVATDGLAAHGISQRPVDELVHQEFMANAVEPLFVGNRVLTRTDRGAIRFADAFVLSESGGRSRVIALFDVSGEELSDVHDAKQFLFLADALIFVADPVIFDSDSGRLLGDGAFSAVMKILSDAGRLRRTSAAVVLNKADLVRFDDPIALWLGRDEGIDAQESLNESMDVYAYLTSRGARAWTRPYREFYRATMHVASAVGSGETGDRFRSGVHPRRVLGPLLSVLAMTGVITHPAARKIGL